jgi:hypothetical protein
MMYQGGHEGLHVSKCQSFINQKKGKKVIWMKSGVLTICCESP